MSYFYENTKLIDSIFHMYPSSFGCSPLSIYLSCVYANCIQISISQIQPNCPNSNLSNSIKLIPVNKHTIFKDLVFPYLNCIQSMVARNIEKPSMPSMVCCLFPTEVGTKKVNHNCNRKLRTTPLHCMNGQYMESPL
jgi:hypothetical protein